MNVTKLEVLKGLREKKNKYQSKKESYLILEEGLEAK
jgi:hypothetical protein